MSELRAKVFTVLNHEDIFYSQYWRGLSLYKTHIHKICKVVSAKPFPTIYTKGGEGGGGRGSRH